MCSLKVHDLIILPEIRRVVVSTLARTPSAVVQRVVKRSIDSLVIQGLGCSSTSADWLGITEAKRRVACI